MGIKFAALANTRIPSVVLRQRWRLLYQGRCWRSSWQIGMEVIWRCSEERSLGTHVDGWACDINSIDGLIVARGQNAGYMCSKICAHWHEVQEVDCLWCPNTDVERQYVMRSTMLCWRGRGVRRWRSGHYNDVMNGHEWNCDVSSEQCIRKRAIGGGQCCVEMARGGA